MDLERRLQKQCDELMKMVSDTLKNMNGNALYFCQWWRTDLIVKRNSLYYRGYICVISNDNTTL